MEKFLGVLFCGGKGTRLGEITKYISKCFVPIYDRPVFKYGLSLLENSKYIDEIIILTNIENDQKLKQTGYRTIIQDDNYVFDMFSGWEYIKKVTNTKKNGVLIPSDNISNVDLNNLIEFFMNNEYDIVFYLYEIKDQKKLQSMGTYDIENRKFSYKSNNPKSKFGVIAPYIVKNEINTSLGDEIINRVKTSFIIHNGYWFDIGDIESLFVANKYIMDNYGNKR